MKRLRGESMRISVFFMVAAAVMLLGGCGGGMNASNSDAPKANKAHEDSAKWVTNHREALFKVDPTKSFISYSSGRALINYNNEFECRICHDSTLREVRKAPDCLDCHVLDPMKYPFQCSSCHGIAPVVTFEKWFSRYSSARRGIPLSQDFVANVRNGVYHQRDVSPAVNHDAVFLPSISQDVCRRCHDDPTGEQRSLADRHHDLMNSNAPWVAAEGCFYCHSFSFSIGPDGIPVFDFTPNRNCVSCHN